MGHDIHVRTDQDDRVRGSDRKQAGSDRKQYTEVRKKGENAILQTILITMPQYDPSTRPKKEGKLLDIERQIAEGSLINISLLLHYSLAVYSY